MAWQVAEMVVKDITDLTMGSSIDFETETLSGKSSKWTKTKSEVKFHLYSYFLSSKYLQIFIEFILFNKHYCCFCNEKKCSI